MTKRYEMNDRPRTATPNRAAHRGLNTAGLCKVAKSVTVTMILGGIMAGGAGFSLVATPSAAHAATSMPTYDYDAPGGNVSLNQGAAHGEVISSAAPSGVPFVQNVAEGTWWVKTSSGYKEAFCGAEGVPFNNTLGPMTPTDSNDPNLMRVAYLWQRDVQGAASDHQKMLDDMAVHKFIENSKNPNYQTLLSTPYGQEISAEVDATWASTAAYTGSYAIHPTVSPLDTKGGGQITNTQVTSASGTVTTQITLTLQGPAVFTANGTNTITINAGDTPAIRATAGGKPNITVTATTANLPLSATIWTQAGNQTQYTAGNVATVTGTGTGTLVNQVHLVITSNAPPYVKAGDALTDVLHVSLAPGETWPVDANGKPVPATISDPFYQSATAVAPAQTIPAGVTKYADGSVTVTGTGDVTATADKKAGPAGHYLPDVQFTAASQGQYAAYFAGDVNAGLSADGETTIQRFKPQYETQVSKLAGDGTFTDTVNVTGAAPKQSISPKGTAYISYDTKACAMLTATGATAPADAHAVGTVTGQRTGNGAVTLPAIQLGAAEANDVRTGQACVWMVDSSDQTALNEAVAPNAALISSETIWMPAAPTTTGSAAVGPAPVPSTPATTPAVEVPTAINGGFAVPVQASSVTPSGSSLDGGLFIVGGISMLLAIGLNAGKSAKGREAAR